MNLFDAHQQWKSRPADQRFWSLAEMHEACLRYARSAAEAPDTPIESLRIEADEGEVLIIGREHRARLTNWAFDQLCRSTAVPAAYMRRLPATLAAQNLSYGIKVMSEDERGPRNLLFHRKGSLMLRAILYDRYTRIWNFEVCRRLMDLPGTWQVPPARPALPDQPGARRATVEDVASLGSFTAIRAGDLIAPAGLYASDHDMFAFLIDPTRVIKDGSEHGLARGVFVKNSEVGAAALEATFFGLRYACGNHIAWDVQGVTRVRVIHIGDAGDRAWRQLAVEVRRYLDAPAGPIEEQIGAARTFQLGGTKDEVLDRLFGQRVATRKQLEMAYDLAEQHVDVDGSPRSVWGLAQGMTRASQTTPYADERAELDAAGARILRIAF